MSSPLAPGAAPAAWVPSVRYVKVRDAAIAAFLFVCAFATILITSGIVVVLAAGTLRFFLKAGITPVQFVTGTEIVVYGDSPTFGILPLIWGTMIIVVGSSLIALPVGLLNAIYLSEYASARARAVLKPSLELLAGIPTIVYGYLALILVTPALRALLGLPVVLLGWLDAHTTLVTFAHRVLLETWDVHVEPFNALSGCIVVGVMIIPLVSSLSEDVLSAVPTGLREAAFSLGATRFEVSTRVVLPAGLSGVIAACLIAISRAVGETMAVVLACGQTPRITFNPLRSIQTMTAYIVQVIGGDAAADSPQYYSLFAVGFSLFLITLFFNLLAGLILRHFREAYE